MHGTNRQPFVSDRPFALPADSVEITLDLPPAPSINKLWEYGRKRVYKSKEYLDWLAAADMSVMATKKPGRLPKIKGPFEARILLNEQMSKADGDNICAKAVLDWCQSRDVIRNDKDCRRGSWEWVEPERAPKGCRVILRSLHG